MIICSFFIMESKIFGIGDVCLWKQSNGYSFSKVKGLESKDIEPLFLINGELNQIFPTSHSETGELAFILQKNGTELEIYSTFSSNLQTIESSFLRNLNHDQFTYLLNQTLIVIENGQITAFDSNKNSFFTKEIPNDSIFIAHTSTQALLISRKDCYLAIITYIDRNEIEFFELPGGYSIMTCACIYNDLAIAFTTNDTRIHLYSANDTIKSVNLPEQMIKILSADLDPYDRACIALSETNILYFIRFDDGTCVKITENVVDFCILSAPFDTIAVITSDEKMKVVNPMSLRKIDSTEQSLINALNSRITESLIQLSKSRQRLHIRECLTDDKDFELPKMVKIFGDAPPPQQEEQQEEQPQQYWIDNVTESSLIIKSNQLINPGSSIFMSSSTIGFEAQTEVSQIDENTIFVNYDLLINNCSSISPIQVFIYSDGRFTYIDEIQVPTKYLMTSREITRIGISYTVSFRAKGINFPSSSFSHDSNSPMWVEEIDKGVILHIKADSCEKFKQRLITATSLLPSTAVFMKIEDNKLKNIAAKKIAIIISKFAQIPPDASLDCDVLLDFKSDIDDNFAALLSYC